MTARTTLRSVGAFNINSIRARLDLLADWLDVADVDVVLLSEIRCVADEFPNGSTVRCGVKKCAWAKASSAAGVSASPGE